MLAIADTGFVVAVALATEQAHEACKAVYLQQQGRIILPQSTVAEVGYLITREGGNLAAANFLYRLSETKYRVVPLEAEDFCALLKFWKSTQMLAWILSMQRLLLWLNVWKLPASSRLTGAISRLSDPNTPRTLKLSPC